MESLSLCSPKDLRECIVDFIPVVKDGILKKSPPVEEKGKYLIRISLFLKKSEIGQAFYLNFNNNKGKQ